MGERCQPFTQSHDVVIRGCTQKAVLFWSYGEVHITGFLNNLLHSAGFTVIAEKGTGKACIHCSQSRGRGYMATVMLEESTVVVHTFPETNLGVIFKMTFCVTCYDEDDARYMDERLGKCVRMLKTQVGANAEARPGKRCILK